MDELHPDFAGISGFDRADQICDAYERAWLEGLRPCLEDYLAKAPAAEHDNLRRELDLIRSDYENRWRVAGETPGDQATVCDRPEASRDEPDYPPRIGRFRIERQIGQGGFGRVYLAHDEQLQRLVALKTPHARMLSAPGVAMTYLAEARTVARLDHPNIVPVYDVGSVDADVCYVVSKYIDGSPASRKWTPTRHFQWA
jgi:serine/threonine protein kinase